MTAVVTEVPCEMFLFIRTCPSWRKFETKKYFDFTVGCYTIIYFDRFITTSYCGGTSANNVEDSCIGEENNSDKNKTTYLQLDHIDATAAVVFYLVRQKQLTMPICFTEKETRGGGR